MPVLYLLQLKKDHSISSYLSAFVLLALFLTLHIGKALHHHSSTRLDTKGAAAAHHLTSAADCDICDFEIAKNGDVVVPVFTSSIQQEPLLHQAHSLRKKMASIGLSFSDRGPPLI